MEIYNYVKAIVILFKFLLQLILQQITVQAFK